MTGPDSSLSPPLVKPWDDREWERLLRCIEQGAVIPTVGPELSLAAEGGALLPLPRVLAARLAERIDVSAGELPEDNSLNEVAARHARNGGLPQDLHNELAQILQKPFGPSPALQQLARISHFNLFLTTALDTMLEAALKEARSVEVTSLAYAPNAIQDLPQPRKELRQPVVYHLLGKPSIDPTTCALTNEDQLEFFYHLQSPLRQPKTLFYELATNNLLLLGGSYSDWLARFFLRAVKGDRRLSESRSVREFIADPRAVSDRGLVLFLQQFSKPTRLYAEAEPAEFVAELHRRWCARNPTRLEVVSPPIQFEAPPPAEMPTRAVFVSYCRQDLNAVQQLASGLRAAGVPFWFDLERLEGGDSFEAKIRKNIRDCTLFIPVISRNTEDKNPRFFKREWNWALDRAQDFLPDDPFILPVFVDDLAEAAARIPDRFLTRHVTRLPGGQVTEAFASRLGKLLAGRD